MDFERGTLYLCATPIGNLSDMTPRVIETLKAVDLIACEDTRNSMKLITHFDIHTPLTSYHEYNKVEKARELIDRLLEGMEVALITDAGMPAISDPGEVLVSMCAEAGIRVTSLPGACACVTALSLSGLSARRFVFEGFLPSEKKERRQILSGLKSEPRTIIIYEAPHHLKGTLKELSECFGDRKIAICRELTKKFEDIRRTSLYEALKYYDENEPRGEYVLVIEGRNADEAALERKAEWLDMSVEEHLEYYEALGFTRKEAMKQAAADRGVSKREIYSKLLQNDFGE